MLEANHSRGAQGLITGWKQIARHFSKDERTVKRWAQGRGLPVHRTPGDGRSAVFAYVSELDAWLTREAALDVAPRAVTSIQDDAPVPPVALAAPRSATGSSRRLWLLAAVLVGVLSAASIWFASAQRRGPTVAPADPLVLEARFNIEKRTGDAMRRAIDLYQQAIAKNPLSVEAHAGLADVYNVVSQYTLIAPGAGYPRAKAAAERAIELDPTSSAGHAALAFNTFYWSRDFKRAFQLFAKAVALDPNNADAHHWYALCAMQDRDFATALREIDLAQQLRPQSALIRANKALILFHAGKTEEAVAILRPLRESEPRLLSPPEYLATLYLAAGHYQDFLREYRAAAQIENNPFRLAIAEAAQAALDQGGGPAMLATYHALHKDGYAQGKVAAFKLALAAAMTGDRTGALAYLQVSFQRNEPDILGLRLEPALLGLHGEPEFKALVREVGLSQDNG
ncbi:tetratricopeptide repeat protein [Methylocella sp. CPCC 101449]|uniref:tetratricopeptide repeat protein n=1 Tax=Methylocella sp. CPCC 101449 TaxID=2987531 RepID=UPI00288D7FB9|nr:tetratricopeptide repeat protein [Methylocella sp. CPCC 101449]MDT2020254.1 tetratricopeptide repeat protein [Methylocella sp. CPCC 101449]